MNRFDKPLPRVLTYLSGGGGGGVRGGRTLMFSHICRLRPFFWVQNLLISIFFWIFMYIFINESTPPPTHTHTNTGHTCSSKCTRVWCSLHLRMRGSRFSLFFVCLFHRGAHMLRSLTSFFFFLTENYSTCINRPVRGPRMTRKSLL